MWDKDTFIHEVHIIINTSDVQVNDIIVILFEVSIAIFLYLRINFPPNPLNVHT